MDKIYNEQIKTESLVLLNSETDINSDLNQIK